MASWMLYSMAVCALLSGAAWFLERGLRPAGAPTRWGWAAAQTIRNLRGVGMVGTHAWNLADMATGAPEDACSG